MPLSPKQELSQFSLLNALEDLRASFNVAAQAWLVPRGNLRIPWIRIHLDT